jgi:hypothetical protein
MKQSKNTPLNMQQQRILMYGAYFIISLLFVGLCYITYANIQDNHRRNIASAGTARIDRQLLAQQGPGSPNAIVPPPQDNKASLDKIMNVLRTAMSFGLGKQGASNIGSPPISPGPGGGGGGGGGTGQPIVGVPDSYMQRLQQQSEAVTVGSYTYYRLPNPINGEYSQEDACVESQYGQPLLLYVIDSVARQYAAYADDPARGNIAGSRLWMGDLNAQGHKSHSFGRDVDIYITDGAATPMQYGSSSSPKYQQRHAIELGKMFMSTNQIDFIFFDGDEVPDAVNAFVRDPANNIQNGEMQADGVHFNHFHVRVKAPRPASDCAAECSKPACGGNFNSCIYSDRRCG